MKLKFYLTAFTFLIFFYPALAQNENKQLADLLNSYYNIKNALVSGDQQAASTNALTFLKTANTIDYKIISEGNINIIVEQAGKISESNSIEDQRNYFSGLSGNMITIVKNFRITKTPVYEVYCPKKKVSWLSSEKTIQNPYYGSAMLDCGEVKEIIYPK
ncbi:MAG: DUF3347 domain-containing protein [Candidatus Dadabacteria bacterium]